MNKYKLHLPANMSVQNLKRSKLDFRSVLTLPDLIYYDKNEGM